MTNARLLLPFPADEPFWPACARLPQLKDEPASLLSMVLCTPRLLEALPLPVAFPLASALPLPLALLLEGSSSASSAGGSSSGGSASSSSSPSSSSTASSSSFPASAAAAASASSSSSSSSTSSPSSFPSARSKTRHFSAPSPVRSAYGRKSTVSPKRGVLPPRTSTWWQKTSPLCFEALLCLMGSKSSIQPNVLFQRRTLPSRRPPMRRRGGCSLGPLRLPLPLPLPLLPLAPFSPFPKGLSAPSPPFTHGSCCCGLRSNTCPLILLLRDLTANFPSGDLFTIVFFTG
mmetsp:Transcript_58947/g.137276  ORF Transcript_58947/g.137276 Transcript_58947/m.137276 type:complete len:289 (+) Transcript_58947:352-1218(+)